LPAIYKVSISGKNIPDDLGPDAHFMISQPRASARMHHESYAYHSPHPSIQPIQPIQPIQHHHRHAIAMLEPKPSGSATSNKPFPKDFPRYHHPIENHRTFIPSGPRQLCLALRGVPRGPCTRLLLCRTRRDSNFMGIAHLFPISLYPYGSLLSTLSI
jgi:hypothetical protein